MAATVTAIATALETLKPLLAEYGFKKRAGAVFTAEVDVDVLGWLGLNRASQHRPPGETEVNAVVGVRHQGIERIVAELRDEEFHPYQPPTVSVPLGQLMPDRRYRSWVFGNLPQDAVARTLVDAVREYGLPFIRSTAELSDLSRRLDEGLGFEHQIAYRRPVALFLAGETRRADEVLDELMTKLGNRTDVAAGEFRRFGEALRHRLRQPS